MSTRKKNGSKFPWLTFIWVGSLGLFTLITALLLRGRDIALLNPKGYIAKEQTELLIVSSAIMLGFAALVMFFIYFFVWRYRESNNKTILNPNAGRSKLLIVTAWASPIMIFIILAGLMLPATQKLEPQRSIEHVNEEMTVRVIAMRWKWLFMYPEQGIASVNYLQIPVDTPVRFELTADEAPMQGFWIPHLGGMLYAMTEHVNPLNLMGDTIGDYEGGASEINGRGFSGMRFTTRVSSREDFDIWAQEVASGPNVLDEAEYARLLNPTEYDVVMTYSSPTNQELFASLIKKYAGSHNHYEASENTHDNHGGSH